MNSEFDFVIFSTADWHHPFWTNKQHVTLQLAELGHRILYIESLGLRKPNMNKRDMSRILKKLLSFFKGIKRVHPRIYVLTPVVLPWHQYAFVRILNDWILLTLVKFHITRLGMKDYFLWTYNPLIVTLLSRFSYRKLIYHCVDDLTAAPRMPKERITDSEGKLLQVSDYIFVTSPALESKFKKLTTRPIWYHNNVADFNHFSKSLEGIHSKPEDLIITKKAIGFIGAISSYKVDFNLLRFFADQRQDYNFYLIGQVGEGDPETTIGVLKRNNIFILGPKPYEDLPKYLHYFDCVLLPCPINGYTTAMFPMKFFEYLAAGKKIVATPLPALIEFKDYFFCASTQKEFLDYLDKAVQSKPTPEEINFFQSLAKKHTYKERTKDMLRLISKN